MTDGIFLIGDGQSELTDEDTRGLIPTHISTRGELYEIEQGNIAVAMLRQPPNVEQLLDEPYLRHFHRSMFNEVWRWAGTYRIRETNIGIEPSGIAIAVRNLVDDARAWVEYSTFDAHELAVRFHHRLVSIHPFPNGNGRHARIAADYLLSGLDGSQFSWGANLGLDTAGLRDKYLSALRSADRGDISDLVRFARS